MAKGFKIDDILGDQSKVHSPAGQKMDIVMLPIGDIEPNPANVIYDVGDVGMLQADIAEHGLRTPLEVTPAGDKYMLVAGHRRWTACKALHAEGDARFGALRDPQVWQRGRGTGGADHIQCHGPRTDRWGAAPPVCCPQRGIDQVEGSRQGGRESPR